MTFGAGPVVVLCFGWLSLISRFLLGNLPQPLADLRQFLFAATIGQKPKMANTHQTLRKNVQQKAADQLLTWQVHRLPAILILVVFVAHLDFTFGDRPDTRIADGGAIRVTGQIGHDGFGLSQPGFGVDDPLDCHQAIKHPVHFRWPGNAVEFTLLVGLAQFTDQLAAEMARQGAVRKQVGTACGMPLTRCIQGATGDQAVQMHMAPQLLPPGMQYRGHPQLPAEPLGIGPKGLERGPHHLEQQVVDQLWVQLHPGVEFVRQGKHQMIVGHRQHRLALLVAPSRGGPPLALGTVTVKAGVVPRLFIRALVTL